MGTKKRSFNPDWYTSYSWLEYSVQKDATFCFACRHFSMGDCSRAEETFTKSGCRDWKHATGKGGILQKHAKCSTHLYAMCAWQVYIVHKENGTSIANSLNLLRNEQIRHYHVTITEVILLCACLEIGLQGHDESSKSLNKGNFREMFQSIVADHDIIIKERLENGPQNATYLSPEIQNLLLNIMGNMVRKTVTEKAGHFSVLADESKDASKKEQLAIVLRSVDEEGVIHERFLTFVEAVSLTAESLTSYLLSVLAEYQLDPTLMVSQGYDGASVMSGNISGVQQRMKEVVPYAVYIHCYAHTLNLALVDCVKRVQVCL